MTEVWAIVGSRDFDRPVHMYRALDEKVKLRGRPESIVSGGARGADTLAEHWAKLRGIQITIHNADWDSHGRAAGAIRNAQIVKEATVVFAFIEDDMTPGTKITIDMARESGTEFEVIKYD